MIHSSGPFESKTTRRELFYSQIEAVVEPNLLFKIGHRLLEESVGSEMIPSAGTDQFPQFRFLPMQNGTYSLLQGFLL